MVLVQLCVKGVLLCVSLIWLFLYISVWTGSVYAAAACLHRTSLIGARFHVVCVAGAYIRVIMVVVVCFR